MPEHLPILSLVIVAVVGLFAGILGGMLGVGGSVIMIPGLVLIFGQSDTPGMGQHLYQAAAMLANVAVSIPAALRHHRAGAMRPAVLKWMLPGALVAVVVGVAVSNLPIFAGSERGVWLGRILAVFLLYVVYINALKVFTRDQAGGADAAEELGPEVVTPGRSASVGGLMGAIAGLLGIGGGAVAVPLQQTILRLRLRSCIANSSAIICISALLGGVYKVSTLHQHGYDWRIGLFVAAALAPTAWTGGRLGASLTHALPIRQVRIAFILLMLVASWKMASLPWP